MAIYRVTWMTKRNRAEQDYVRDIEAKNSKEARRLFEEAWYTTDNKPHAFHIKVKKASEHEYTNSHMLTDYEQKACRLQAWIEYYKKEVKYLSEELVKIRINEYNDMMERLFNEAKMLGRQDEVHRGIILAQ